MCDGMNHGPGTHQDELRRFTTSHKTQHIVQTNRSRLRRMGVPARECSGRGTSPSEHIAQALMRDGSGARRACDNTAQQVRFVFLLCTLPSVHFRRCPSQAVEPPSPTREGPDPGKPARNQGTAASDKRNQPSPAEEGEPQEHTDAGHTIFSARSAPSLKLNVDMLELVLFQAKVPPPPSLVRQHEHAASSERLLVCRVSVCVWSNKLSKRESPCAVRSPAPHRRSGWCLMISLVDKTQHTK
jgi:hypothetical protein